jgi:excisionase family DNA binding protein
MPDIKCTSRKTFIDNNVRLEKHFVKCSKGQFLMVYSEKRKMFVWANKYGENEMPQQVGDRVLLSTAEACEAAEVSLTYIQRLLRDERVEGIKMGRDWFVYEDSLKTFMTQPRKRGRPHKEDVQGDSGK